MIRRLALTVLPVFLLVAGVALAAPARTVTVSAAEPEAKWEGGPGNGVGQGVAAVRCAPVIYECEDTLVEVKDAGDLRAEIKGDENAVDLDVAIYASDADGTAPGPGDDTGEPIAEDVSTNKDAKATAKKLKPGFYVVRVRFFSATAANYDGTATLLPAEAPAPVPEPTPAPAPTAPAEPSQGGSSGAEKKKAKAKCRKKAKKIKNKKKRKAAMKRCNRKA